MEGFSLWVLLKRGNWAANHSSLFQCVELGTLCWGKAILFMLTEGMEGGSGDRTFGCLHFVCCWRSWHSAPDHFPTSGCLHVPQGSLQLPLDPQWMPVPISSHWDHPSQFCLQIKKKGVGFYTVFTEVFSLSFMATRWRIWFKNIQCINRDPRNVTL